VFFVVHSFSVKSFLINAMSDHLNNSFKVVLLDIEGTTTPVDFVYQTLFPYARKRLPDYLSQNFSTAEMRPIIKQLHQENSQDIANHLNPPLLSSQSPEEELATLTDYLYWLMDIDRKSTPLKALQGEIWQQGYETGELLSQVFTDVPEAFLKWKSQGKTLAIFSSGSVLAQKLLFAHTVAGDLSKYVSAYFDTNIGAKREAESYQRIAKALAHPPQEVIFFSDVVAELDAAREAGMQAILCVRPGNAPQPAAHGHSMIHNFTGMF
jgi:enolase-phosphatase E1